MTSLVERMVAPANNFLDNVLDLQARVEQLERYPDAGGDGSAAALADESYLVLNSSTDLTNERVLTAGDGLTGIDNEANSTFILALGTPGTLSVLSPNLATGGTHYHAVTTSSNPGATQVILATAPDGGVQLLRLGIGTDPDTDNAVKVVNGTWFGLGSATGRIVIVDAATDQVQIQTADLYLATGYGIVHQAGVTAGQFLRANGTRYVPDTLDVADITDLAYATPNLTLGTSNAVGAANSVIRSDATILVFDATVPTTIAAGDAAGAGAAGVTARRDHRHGITTTVVGAASTIVATDASGRSQVAGLGVGVAPGANVLRSAVAVILDDDAGDSPELQLVGGTNNDTASIRLKNSAMAGQSDLGVKLCDDAGESQVQVEDSSGAVKAYIDSKGAAHFHGIVDANPAGIRTVTSATNVSDPPTAAEIVAIFGEATTVEGFIGIIVSETV